LPKYKSGIVTEVYITDVICKKIYCPLFKDIKLLPCPCPPDKDTLIKYAKDIKTPNKLPLGITEDYTPNKEWLLTLLSTHRPDLPIFKKDYVAPPRIVKMADQFNINLPSDFLESLPASRKKTKAKRLSMLSKGKMESKLERIKDLQQKFKAEGAKIEDLIKASK